MTQPTIYRDELSSMSGLDIMVAAVRALGAALGHAFSTQPFTWGLFSIAIVAVALAGREFANHRGWAGVLWLIAFAMLYAGAAAIAPAEASGAALGMAPR